jgi:hypothetical protein
MNAPNAPQCLSLGVLNLDQLPAVIGYRDPQADPEDADGFIFKPLAEATVDELRAHVELVSAELAIATRRYQQLRLLYEIALLQGATAETSVFAAMPSANGSGAEG